MKFKYCPTCRRFYQAHLLACPYCSPIRVFRVFRG